MHRFVRVSSFYFSVEERIPTLTALLWNSSGPFGFDKPIERAALHVPGWLAQIIRIARIIALVSFHRHARHNPDSNLILRLEYPGHIALRTYADGFRVFDLQAKTVRFLMPRSFDEADRGNFIRCREKVAQHDIAARLLDASETEGWIEEEFVNGRHPASFSNCEGWVLKSLIPLMAGMIDRSESRSVSARERAAEVYARINQLTEPLNSPLSEYVNEFSRRVAESLSRHGDTDVLLAYGHGDIWEGNVLCDGDRIVLVDWERYAERSAMFDVVFLLFHQVCWSMSPVTQPRRVLEQYFDVFQTRITETAPTLAQQLDEEENRAIYRRLAYLETILESLNEPLELDEAQLARNTVGWAKAFGEIESGYDEKLELPACPKTG